MGLTWCLLSCHFHNHFTDELLPYNLSLLEARSYMVIFKSCDQIRFGISSGAGHFSNQINSILISPKDGKSTEDQIKAGNGDLFKIVA